MVLPTAPTAYTVAQLEADPIALNSNLGTYTNFVNLLDLCGLAVPVRCAPTARPLASRFSRPAGTMRAREPRPRLACRHQAAARAASLPLPPLAPLPAKPAARDRHRRGRRASVGHAAERRIARAGARASSRRPRPRRITGSTRSTTTPPKPGMLRVDEGKGSSIELEIWALSAEASAVSSPRPAAARRSARCGLRTAGREWLSGRAAAIEGARDISEFGGWRAFVAEKAAVSTPASKRSSSLRNRKTKITHHKHPLTSASRSHLLTASARKPRIPPHRAICARIAAAAPAVAAQDRDHHPVVLDMGFRQPSEIAELRAAERLHARPRRDRHLREIIVMRAGIDRAVKRSLTS